MRRWVVHGCHTVGPFGEYLAILDDERGEWSAPARANILDCQRDRMLHESIGSVSSRRHDRLNPLLCKHAAENRRDFSSSRQFAAVFVADSDNETL